MISRASLGTPARPSKRVIACAEARHHLICNFLISFRCTVGPLLRTARNVFPTSKDTQSEGFGGPTHLDKCSELAVSGPLEDDVPPDSGSASPLNDAPPVSGGSGKSAGVKCVVTSSVAFLRGSRGSCPRLGTRLTSCAIAV